MVVMVLSSSHELLSLWPSFHMLHVLEEVFHLLLTAFSLAKSLDL